MSNKSQKVLKIGDKLYRCHDHAFRVQMLEYEVYEVRETADITMYAIECKNCRDHGNCKLLVTSYEQGQNGWFRFVKMLNNDGYDDDGEYNINNDQELYHDTQDGIYYTTTKRETTKLFIDRRIRHKEKVIEQNKMEIKELEHQISELKSILESYEGN